MKQVMTEKNREILEERGEFQMRQLDLGDLEQFNDLLRYAFQVTNDELIKSGWTEDEMMYAKKPVLQNAYVLGWFYHEKLASMIVVYPMQVNVQDELMDMGGVTGVATYPEYVGRGLIAALIRRVIAHMKETGQVLSFLYPYFIPLYRKFGWEIVSDKITFTLKDSQLPKPVPVPGMVERVELDCEDLKNLYSYSAAQTHGALVRGNLEWEEYWRWDNEDMIAAIYYNEKHKPLGYVVYYLRNEVFHVKEIVSLNSEARHGIWNYISAHKSMLNTVVGNNYSGEPMAFLFEDSEMVEKIEPYIMARIVDVQSFLQSYPFPIQPDYPIHFRIRDGYAPWNQGDFVLYWEDEETRCEKLEEAPDQNLVELDIRSMTAMMLGYKRPTFLYDHEYLKAEYYMVQILERLIPVGKPCFADYF
jgi:predicted acetyltransferase